MKVSDEMDATLPITFSVNKYGETVCKAIEEASKKSAEAEEMIGRYRKQRLIGKGAFGAVYLAYDDQLEREVAIKVPNPELIVSGEDAARDSFLTEARQLAQVSHPNIVTIHDVGFTDEICYVVSEFVSGPDLNRWMQDNYPTWEESAQMVASIADGLAATHVANVIHRDVKPANIIVSERTEGPVPILCDFGLAISESTAGKLGSRRGDVSGTPNFMSPEAARGEGHRIDGRTDIYSLGVVLYRMLTGQLPFASRNLADLLDEIMEAEARPPRQFVKGLPRELEEICLKAIAKQIPDRYTTAGDFAEDLRTLLKGQQETISPAAIETKLAVEKAQPVSSGEMKILVAEDNDVTRMKLQADLEKWGHEVVAAENGVQAWEYFQNDNFSVVLTDWMMPEMDGIELVKRIRATGRASYVYVIMLTAKAEKHDIVLGMGAGADDFLAKPYHRDELNVRLRAGKRVVDMTRAIGKSSRRMERGIRAAAEIQHSFLPSPSLEIPGLKFGWEYCPCDELGGDMLGIVPLDESHVGLYVLDVNGSGVPASLLATNVSRCLGSAADPASILVDHESGAPVEPEVVGRILNQQFSGNPEINQYFTLTYGILNRETLEFRYTCAGHPPSIHQSGEEAPVDLEGFGLPIGVTADNNDFHQESVVLKPGDRLIFYSNGLVNTPNSSDELFGRSRLINAIDEGSQMPIEDVPSKVLSEVRNFGDHSELSDDVTILAIEIE